jgi:rhodanese-related sulfurtransferase
LRNLLAISLTLLAVCGAAWAERAAAPPVMDFASYTKLAESGTPFVLIDTRIPRSYQAGRLPGAISLPGYLFDKGEVPGLPADRSLTMVAYCNGDNCGISHHVAERLLDIGYENVFVFDDGVKGWVEQGQQLVNDRHEALPTIAHADLAALLSTGATVRLIDARPAAPNQPTIAGAVNLPPELARPGNQNLPPSRDDLVVVFGAGPWDSRPFHAADRLTMLGYKKVKLYKPGAAGWRKNKPGNL